jgi:DNA-binding XRE family transcriptional regulator
MDAPFGELLRRYRERAGFSQARLAEVANLSLRGINDLERGQRQSPRWNTVIRLADALRLTPAERDTFWRAARRARVIKGMARAPLEVGAPEAAPQRTVTGSAVPAATVLPLLKTPNRYRHILPIQATPLLGRVEASQAVRDLLQRDAVRLVTLSGPGGVGKTRLAIQVATDLVAAYQQEPELDT